MGMAIENVELMQECSPENLPIVTVRFKLGKGTEEEGTQKIIKMTKSRANMK